MPTYATATQLRDYADLTGGSDSDLDRVLERAERDVDGLVGYHGALVAGLKFVPGMLTADAAEALQRATCAQAEYRITMGEDFMVRGQPDRTRGPSFDTEGKLPYIGPKVRAELRAAPGLLSAWGTPR